MAPRPVAGEPFFTYEVGLLATAWLVEQAGPEAVPDFFRFGGHEAARQSLPCNLAMLGGLHLPYG